MSSLGCLQDPLGRLWRMSFLSGVWGWSRPDGGFTLRGTGGWQGNDLDFCSADLRSGGLGARVDDTVDASPSRATPCFGGPPSQPSSGSAPVRSEPLTAASPNA